MKYYKQIENEIITAYISSEDECENEILVEITQEEYSSAIEAMRAKNLSDEEASEQSKDELIAELEKENAALLYQVLTGEVYSDV